MDCSTFPGNDFVTIDSEDCSEAILSPPQSPTNLSWNDGWIDPWAYTEEQKKQREIDELIEAQKEARGRLVGTVPCTTLQNYGGEEKVVDIHTSRSKVENMLPTFRHLQAHLRSSMNILTKYTMEEFAWCTTLPSFTDGVAVDRIIFMHNHSAVSETLAQLSDTYGREPFGLPDNSDFRLGRNEFCHYMLKPGKKYLSVEELKKTLQSMEKTLADEEAWSEKKEEDKEVSYDLDWPTFETPGEDGEGEEAIAEQDTEDEEWWPVSEEQEDIDYDGYEIKEEPFVTRTITRRHSL
ncbi:hypothetical protein E8E13_005743 [Curvularia kusanoi]|uniref:Uncharacterized protein n=1 Tax=Curvularia kusanoi TaxID=90978 RepID=A0A9P4TI44_CURKU|nr:hypothetical protein E8E13_005743 [Curvularia kusanoi]